MDSFVTAERGPAVPMAAAREAMDPRLAKFIQWRGAPLLPVVGSTVLIVLTEVTRRMAVHSGHVDVTLHNRSVSAPPGLDMFCGEFSGNSSSPMRLVFPAISPATRLPPERWVWTFGVCLVCLSCLVPTFVSGWEVFRRAARLHGGCSCMYKFLFALLPMACVGLFGEACIPLQPDILDIMDDGGVTEQLTALRDGAPFKWTWARLGYNAEDPPQLAMQSQVHLFCAGMLFGFTILHGLLAIIVQCSAPNSRRTFRCPSMCAKLFSAGIVGLSMFGIIPLFIRAACPHDVCDPRACLSDIGGLSQRGVVVGIALFLATYGLDIKALQRSMEPLDTVAEMQLPLGPGGATRNHAGAVAPTEGA